MKCILSLSHGNSAPERGFSINKLILKVHGYSTYKDTLRALWLVKDELLQVGGETKFPITKEILADIKASYTRSEADQVEKNAAQETELQRRKESKAADAARESIHKEVKKAENDISEAKSGISVANNLIFEKAPENIGKRIQRQLKVGNERKKKFKEDLGKLENKKKN